MSKKNILARIQQAKPAATPLPEIPKFHKDHLDPLGTFINNSGLFGTQVILRSELKNMNEDIHMLFPEAQQIASLLPSIKSTVDLNAIKDPHDLVSVDVAIVKGQVGVAENGAIWITEKDCGHRVLPFITQHLIICLKQSDLVHNMHQAYAKIQIDDTGFGLFVAGPSKTADIEQSLVIGAQGARSLTVIIEEGT